MKKLLFVFIWLFAVVCNAQIVDIPDPNFKTALLDMNGLDANADGEIQVSEAEAWGVIVADNRNISDLTGVEAFINLSQLYVSFNNLTTIDVSNSPNLIELLVEYNNLDNLDVSNNDRLLWLWFTGNNISEIDLSNNPDIELLWASNNDLQSIDVSPIESLASLSLGNNQLSTIDVTSNPNLSHLNFEAGNMFTELDLSQNPLLCSVVVGNNSLLEYINLKNGGNTLLVEGSTCYFGNGNSNSILIATNNPILETICVDDVTFAQDNFPHIPPQTVFIDDCLLGTDEAKIASIRLYPNPTTNFITIASEELITKIEIYNVLGQLMFSTEGLIANEQVDLSNMSKGNYFAKIIVGNSIEVIQLMKI